MVSTNNKTCKDLSEKLMNITLRLGENEIVIPPTTYLWPISGGCQIGITRGDKEEYRLGTSILDNIYVGLDFKHSEKIMIAKKKKSCNPSVETDAFMKKKCEQFDQFKLQLVTQEAKKPEEPNVTPDLPENK